MLVFFNQNVCGTSFHWKSYVCCISTSTLGRRIDPVSRGPTHHKVRLPPQPPKVHLKLSNLAILNQQQKIPWNAHFLWHVKSPCSYVFFYDVPIVFLWFSWWSHHFPMVSFAIENGGLTLHPGQTFCRMVWKPGGDHDRLQHGTWTNLFDL